MGINIKRLTKKQIYFNHLGYNFRFTIYHNLPKEFGISINNAFDNWYFRTNKINVEDFSNYVKSKDKNIICLTKKEYNSIKNSKINESTRA